jgi:hypothetical protein
MDENEVWIRRPICMNCCAIVAESECVLGIKNETRT